MTNDKLTQEEEMVFANMQRQGWSTRWGNDGPQDEERVTTEGARQTCCGCSATVGRSGAKPLLVIQYKGKLDTESYVVARKEADRIEARTGYNCVVYDCMDKTRVDVFGVDAPGLEALTLDQLIDMLESLKRMREAARGV